MKDYNKENLKRLLALFAAVLIFFSALATLGVSGKLWPVSLPSSGAAIAMAVILFKKGYLEKDG